MFNNSSPDPDAIARVKAMVTEAFQLPDDALLRLAELRCHETGCPPIETVITALAHGTDMRDWRFSQTCIHSLSGLCGAVGVHLSHWLSSG